MTERETPAWTPWSDGPRACPRYKVGDILRCVDRGIGSGLGYEDTYTVLWIERDGEMVGTDLGAPLGGKRTFGSWRFVKTG